jgi:hypothetical protein
MCYLNGAGFACLTKGEEHGTTVVAKIEMARRGTRHIP